MWIIYLSKKVCSNLELDNYAIGAYVALRSIYNVRKPIVYVSIAMLCYEIAGTAKYTRYFKEGIQSGIESLIQAGLISVKENISKGEYILDLSGLYIDNGSESEETEFYTMISQDELHKLYQIPGRHNKFALLRYFVLMVGSINQTDSVTVDGEERRNFVGYMGTEYLAQISGISYDVGLEYTSLLESAGILYVYRHRKMLKADEGIKSIKNHYGRYKDAKYIMEFAKQYEQYQLNKKQIIAEKAESNKRRSLAQKYRRVENGFTYSEKEMQEIFEYVKRYNESVTDPAMKKNEDVFNIVEEPIEEMQETEEIVETTVVKVKTGDARRRTNKRNSSSGGTPTEVRVQDIILRMLRASEDETDENITEAVKEILSEVSEDVIKDQIVKVKRMAQWLL